MIYRPMTPQCLLRHFEACTAGKAALSSSDRRADDDNTASVPPTLNSTPTPALAPVASAAGLKVEKSEGAGGVPSGGAAVDKKKKRRSRPLDLDEMCGVLIKGEVPCRRCLMCKQHSYDAKRRVPGRSVPFDRLLLQLRLTSSGHGGVGGSFCRSFDSVFFFLSMYKYKAPGEKKSID
jgi:hypothetical protein